MAEVLIVELKTLCMTDLIAMRRHEVVEHAMQVHHGSLLEVEDHYVVPEWDDAKRAEICRRVAACLACGGAVWGARADVGLVALAALDGRPVGGDPGVLALDLLHVSAPWRGRGLARELTVRVATVAQSLGAHTLYVSASNSQRTVAVYRRFGAVLADPPDPDWLVQEPLDVHLRMPLPLAHAQR